MASEAIIQRHIKAFNDHDADAWAADYAENAVLHDPQYPQPLRGRDAIRKDITDFFTAFPDIQYRVTTVVLSGDNGAVEGIGEGTHGGPIEFPGGTIPATNKRAAMPFAAFMSFGSGDLITEERRYYDQAGMMQQLGLAS